MALPTPVLLETLMDATAEINLFNDGIETQAVSPRTLGTQRVTVQVKDDPLSPRLVESVADADVLNSVSDSAATFVTDGVAVGDTVVAVETGISALITEVTSETVLVTGTTDLLPDGDEAYYIIAAADLGYWTQRDATGEWKRSNIKDGNNKLVAYVNPSDASAIVVDQTVLPA